MKTLAFIPFLALGLNLAGAQPCRFTFGTAPAPTRYTAIDQQAPYTPATGYGFESGSRMAFKNKAATSEQPFLFSVKVPEGNYRVLITFGDEDAESTTTVKAEARRLMLENVHTRKGEFLTREFNVNVRTPRISAGTFVRLKQREKETEMVTWDDKLTLEFNGSHPSVRSLEITPDPAAVTIFIAGDSTVCDQPREPWNSWGQMLPRFLQPGVAIANYAQSGESIKSSLAARRFEKIFTSMKPADWLFIQFGHNDMKDKAPNALATYKSNLKKLVAETREKGGIPLLITSMERKAGVNAPTLGNYPETVRAVANEDNVALIDLNSLSLDLYKALGPNLDKAFQDGTHHNNYGSYELAKCITAGIRANKLGLANFLTDDVLTFTPSQPDLIATFKVPASPMTSLNKPEGN